MREHCETKHPTGGDDSLERQRRRLADDGCLEFEQYEVETAEWFAGTELFHSRGTKLASCEFKRTGHREQQFGVVNCDSEWSAADGGEHGYSVRYFVVCRREGNEKRTF